MECESTGSPRGLGAFLGLPLSLRPMVVWSATTAPSADDQLASGLRNRPTTHSDCLHCDDFDVHDGALVDLVDFGSLGRDRPQRMDPPQTLAAPDLPRDSNATPPEILIQKEMEKSGSLL